MRKSSQEGVGRKCDEVIYYSVSAFVPCFAVSFAFILSPVLCSPVPRSFYLLDRKEMTGDDGSSGER